MKEAGRIFVEGFLFIVLSNSIRASCVLSTDPVQRQWGRSPLSVAGGIHQLASQPIIRRPLIPLLLR